MCDDVGKSAAASRNGGLKAHLLVGHVRLCGTKGIHFSNDILAVK
jgi:hypothetical protein